MRVTQMRAFDSKTPLPARPHSAGLSGPSSAEYGKVGKKLKNILQGFEKDDYILAIVILVLIFEGCDDYILLAVLGYLFIMGLDWQ